MKMKLIQCALRSLDVGLSHQFRISRPRFVVRAFSAGAEANESDNKFETRDDFEQRIFGSFTGNSSNDSPSQQSFFRRLDKAEKAHNNYDFGGRFNSDRAERAHNNSDFGGRFNSDRAERAHNNSDFGGRFNSDRAERAHNNSDFGGRFNSDRAERAHNNSDFGGRFNLDNRSEFFDGLDESFNTLSDGMDDKLKEAATCYDAPEIVEDPDYEYRPDVNWSRKGDTYELRDLDIRKPGVWEPNKREEFETTTEEVLRKADFRNVRFLANFITEAGIIIKRSQTKISAKAQRKVAREIKTARAFGLMPFTTMGTKHFKYGKTMESLDADFEFETYDTSYNFVNEEASQARP